MVKICVIPGDGIGPEVVNAAVSVLEKVGGFEFLYGEAGIDCVKKYGTPLPEETVQKAKECKVSLYGAATTPAGFLSTQSVAVSLRKELDLFANIRPVKSIPGVECVHKNMDVIIVRENVEGLYSGLDFPLTPDIAIAIRKITKKNTERLAKLTFELAKRENRKKVTVVHKANILKASCGLFRDTCFEVSKNYNIPVDEMFVDACAMRLAMKPWELDVILTSNLFGDILSDLTAGLTGGLGLAPGANIGEKYAVFEPVHGSAPKHAGKNIVNPSATLLACVMLLKHIGKKEQADKLEKAIVNVILEKKFVTYDLGGATGTKEMALEIAKRYEKL